MTDLNAKIEAAKNEIATVRSEIQQLSRSKQDQTLSQAASSTTLTALKPFKSRRVLKGHFGKITALHWNHETKLVSAGQDGNLLIWNPITGNKLQSIVLQSNYVMSVGMEKSGNLVACGGLDNLCSVYNLQHSKSTVTEMASHDGFISCCRFLNPNSIITSSGDSTCILWDVEKSVPVSRFAEHTADALFVSIASDNSTFASCSVDKSVKLWDVRAPQKATHTLFGYHTDDINAVEFLNSSDNHVVATSSQDNTCRIFDVRANNQVQQFGTPNKSESNSAIPGDGLTSLALSKSGRMVVCGNSNGNVVGYDVLKNAVALFADAAHTKNVSCVGVSPAGDAFCSGSWDTLIKVFA